MRVNRIRLLVAVSIVVLVGTQARARDGKGTVVLDTSGFWRTHYTLRAPVERDGKGVKPFGETFGVHYDTRLPPKDWKSSTFDDSLWSRRPGAPLQSWSWSEAGKANVGCIAHHRSSLALALVCMRGKFQVKDPARVGDMTLEVRYRGGVIVYLNGKEIVRGHVAGDVNDLEALAEDYPLDTFTGADGKLFSYRDKLPPKVQKRIRVLENINVPAKLLQKGTNVLAVEIHRTAYPTEVRQEMMKRKRSFRYAAFDNCGLHSIRLKAAGDGVVPNVVRPKEVQAWNSNPLAPDFDYDFADPGEPLRPIRIVGTRNGVFSGKVLLGSRVGIRNLKVSVSPLVSKEGRRIPASAVELRYALPTESEQYVHMHYPAPVYRFDALAEEAPAEVPVRTKTIKSRSTRTLPGQPKPVFGATVPVWVTVHVPADAEPGDYEGKLVARADGIKPIEARLEVKVNGFRLPDPDGFGTFADVIQSPDSLAMHYGVELWSEAHWKLIEKSLKLLRNIGSDVAYLPLICHTNLGNAESMVRWIKHGDSYRYDFSAFEKYLDMVVKQQGRPRIVCLYVWDYNAQEGVPVTGIGEGGQAEVVKLPAYGDPKSKALWRPVIAGVLERLRKHGLENETVFGVGGDRTPGKDVVDFFGALAPGVAWTVQSHGSAGDRFIRRMKCAYKSDVWRLRNIAYPDQSWHGWNNERRRHHGPSKYLTHFPRDMRNSWPLTRFRLLGEMEIGGELNGFSRLGADFWPVKQGRLSGATPGGSGVLISDGRYPQTSWRNLNVRIAMLAPGPEGPVATVRFEMMREGLQECEARIFIEKALLEKKISGGLAERCRKLIKERNRTILMGLNTHFNWGMDKRRAGFTADGWATGAGLLGDFLYLSYDWQEQSDKLYAAAAEVAAKLGMK